MSWKIHKYIGWMHKKTYPKLNRRSTSMHNIIQKINFNLAIMCFSFQGKKKFKNSKKVVWIITKKYLLPEKLYYCSFWVNLNPIMCWLILRHLNCTSMLIKQFQN